MKIRDDKDILYTVGVKRVSRDSDDPCGDDEVRANDVDGILEGVGHPAKDIEYISARIEPEQKVVHFDDINTDEPVDSKVDRRDAHLVFGKRTRELTCPTSRISRRKLDSVGTDGIPLVINEDDREIRDDKDKLYTVGVKRVSRDSDHTATDAKCRAVRIKLCEKHVGSGCGVTFQQTNRKVDRSDRRLVFGKRARKLTNPSPCTN